MQAAQAEVIRPWGRYRVLGSGPGTRIKLLVIEPGRAISLQRHLLRREHWTVLSGEGWMVRGKSVDALWRSSLARTECLSLPAEEWHQAGVDAAAKQPLVVLEVWFGAELSEEDIERSSSTQAAKVPA